MARQDTATAAREQRFARVFSDTYAAVLRFVERRVDPSEAEDVVADVFVVLWRRLDDIPAGADDVRAWLYGVARHTLMTRARGEGRRRALAVRIAAEEIIRARDADPELVNRRLDLARAWTRLSGVDQEALALTVWEGLDARRAARILGISPVAYRLRLSRARKRLRAELRGGDTSTDVAATVAARRRTA